MRRAVEVVKVEGVGFQIVTIGSEGRKARALFQTAEAANAEARILREIGLGLEDVGQNLTGQRRARTKLKLWEASDAKSS